MNDVVNASWSSKKLLDVDDEKACEFCGNDDLGIEDSGGQLNGPHYDMCACGPNSRRYLISWLPRAQLSLSKELFQLESPPPTLALAKYTSLLAVLHETRHIRLFRIDRPTRIDQPDRVSYLVRY